MLPLFLNFVDRDRHRQERVYQLYQPLEDYRLFANLLGRFE